MHYDYLISKFEQTKKSLWDDGQKPGFRRSFRTLSPSFRGISRCPLSSSPAYSFLQLDVRPYSIDNDLPNRPTSTQSTVCKEVTWGLAAKVVWVYSLSNASALAIQRRQKTKRQITHMSGVFCRMRTSYVHPTILFRYLQTTVAYAICFVGHLSINQTLELETHSACEDLYLRQADLSRLRSSMAGHREVVEWS